MVWCVGGGGGVGGMVWCGVEWTGLGWSVLEWGKCHIY